MDPSRAARQHAAFSFPAAALNLQDLHARLLYFGTMTLMTVGYGDITPVNPVVRSLAALEGIIKQPHHPDRKACFDGAALFGNGAIFRTSAGEDDQRISLHHVHRLFAASVLMKGVDGVLEMIGGILFMSFTIYLRTPNFT